MSLKIYNSLTNQKEEFCPLEPGKVKMYVCGPTVYDEPHIGHLRSAYVFDVMRRYLSYRGYQVQFIRNVTDVDDKIIEKARQNNPADLQSEVQKVSEQYLRAYKRDLQALGIEEPTHEPKATGHVPDMIRLIERLLKKGAAYESQGDVYFDVAAFAAYGKLSHQKKDEMQDHVRIDPNEKKKSPLDFALWKKSKEDEPAWPSPWGQGRPGWHIECSAMSMKYLGETFDIHGGGRDLIFPHHENEIAQSEAVTGAAFAKHWLHHGLVTVNGQKMSKSLKNYVTLGELQKKSGAAVEDLKFLFLGTHYGMPLDYSEEKMKMERSVREKFFYFFDDAVQSRMTIKSQSEEIKRFEESFKEAMDNDFNTPQALTVMHELMHHARKASDPCVMVQASLCLRKMGAIFGLFGEEQMQESSSLSSVFIQSQIEARKIAKGKNDFKKADEIRNNLLKEGIELIDSPDGKTRWRKKS